MKKLLTIFALALCAMFFAGCPTNGGGKTYQDNSDVVGTWTASRSSTSGYVTTSISLNLTIDKSGTWVLTGSIIKSSSITTINRSGSWKRNGNVLTMGDNSATLVDDRLSAYFYPYIDGISLFIFTKNGSTPKSNTKLTINNQSFTDLTAVQWKGVSFGDIELGKSVTKEVTEGGAYIFFSRATNPIDARINEYIIIEKDETRVFTFSDNTSIVQADDLSNTGELSRLVSKLPYAPAEFSVSAGDGSITAQWQAVTGAVQYKVYCGTNPDTPPSLPVKTITGTSVVITDVINDTRYYLWVQAVNSQYESPFSDRASGTPAVSVTTLSWFGNWTQNSENNYTSNSLLSWRSSTWETLTVTTSGGCTLMVLLTAQTGNISNGSAAGYASKLDGTQSNDTLNTQLKVYGASSQSYIYTIPAGVHTIHIGFYSAYSYDYGNMANDRVTVTVQLQ